MACATGEEPHRPSSLDPVVEHVLAHVEDEITLEPVQVTFTWAEYAWWDKGETIVMPVITEE